MGHVRRHPYVRTSVLGNMELIVSGGSINVWKPLETVMKDPLAVCDYNTTPSSDLVNVSHLSCSRASSYLASLLLTKTLGLREASAESELWQF